MNCSDVVLAHTPRSPCVSTKQPWCWLKANTTSWKLENLRISFRDTEKASCYIYNMWRCRVIIHVYDTCIFRVRDYALRNEIFAQCLTACNSGMVGWKNLVPGSYCRAAQELQNGGWIMGIGWSKPGCPTFCARYFLWALASGMHKTVCRGAHGCFRAIGLEREESRGVALSSGLWSPRSEVWSW